jgi:hypothetical protein
MLRRLTEYLGAKPRRAAMIVMTLVVVLILVVAGNLLQLMDVGRYFEPPYPSEETSLSLVNNGVRWDNPIMYQGASYNKTLFHWRNLGGQVASDYEQAQLSSGSNTTVVVTAAQSADLSYWWNLSITDSTGDGMPGSGDYIIFTGEPQQSDTVYTIALVYLAGEGGGGLFSEISYAIHDGKFYSWWSDTARTSPPWWYGYGYGQ